MILMLIFLTSVTSTLATTKAYYGGGIGNEQYYTVYFDEEGDAIVMAKLSFQNTGDDTLDFVILEVPGQITVLNAVQEIQVEHENDNYYQGYYYTTEYETVELNTEILSESTLLTMEFPEVIDEQEIGTILLYYKIAGLAEEEMGLYNFEFTTIKSSYDTYYVRVSAEAINGLYMEDVNSDINYQDWGFVVMEDSAAVEIGVMSFSDEDMSEASRSIGYYGGFVKEAYGLDPYESFSVSGEYATSEFRMHLVRNVVLGGLSIGLLLLIGVVLRKNLHNKRSIKHKYKRSLTISSVSGMIVGFFVTLTTWAADNLNQWLDWQSAETIIILLGLTTILMGILVIFGPGLIFGLQEKDWKIGVACGITSLLSMLITTIVAVLVIALV